MNEFLELINRFVGYENFSLQDFKYIKEELENNNLDTKDIEKFIEDLSEKCNKFANSLAEQFNSLSKDQIKCIDILNQNKIKWNLNSDWNYDKKGYTYKVVIDSKEEDK
jgi:hypothetical protein